MVMRSGLVRCWSDWSWTQNPLPSKEGLVLRLWSNTARCMMKEQTERWVRDLNLDTNFHTLTHTSWKPAGRGMPRKMSQKWLEGYWSRHSSCWWCQWTCFSGVRGSPLWLLQCCRRGGERQRGWNRFLHIIARIHATVCVFHLGNNSGTSLQRNPWIQDVVTSAKSIPLFPPHSWVFWP